MGLNRNFNAINVCYSYNNKDNIKLCYYLKDYVTKKRKKELYNE